jgi:hypothetical protein
MAITQVTLFRVVQIFKGNIVKDLVMRQPRPVSLGVHLGCDLVAPLPGQTAQHVLFSPAANGRFELHMPKADGQSVLAGKLTRKGGSTASVEELALGMGPVALEPGDWGLFTVAGSDEVQIFCQYVRIPVSTGVSSAANLIVTSMADQQWTILAAVVIGAFLMLAFLHKPHGTHFESGEISRRFSTMFKSEKKRELAKKKKDQDRKRKAVVIKEAQDLVRRPTRSLRSSDRVVFARRDVRNRRINKGGLLALNRAIRSSSAVNRLFRKQDSLFSDVDKSLSGLSGPGGSGGGSGDGIEDPEATRGTGGAGGAVGRTDGGRGPRLGGPVRDRGTLSGRGFSKVRVARVGLGGGSVSGTGLSRSQIFRVVRTRRGFIKWCYETALKRNPAMGGGKIVVQFKIAPTGQVVQARAAGNTLAGGGAVASCITRAVRRWRFPQSQGYSVVRFPFLFSSGLK